MLRRRTVFHPVGLLALCERSVRLVLEQPWLFLADRQPLGYLGR